MLQKRKVQIFCRGLIRKLKSHSGAVYLKKVDTLNSLRRVVEECDCERCGVSEALS